MSDTFLDQVIYMAILLGKIPLHWCRSIAAKLAMGEPLYILVQGVMILFFSYFWVATQFNPIQIADDLKRRGGYIPGIRPGRPTAERSPRVQASPLRCRQLPRIAFDLGDRGDRY